VPIRLHNTYSREVEELVPIDPAGEVIKMYTCGPTVYGYAHIGNFRAYVFEDLLQRHLEVRGYQVQRVMNLTDVDDKTIRNSAAAGVPLGEFTQKFKDAFFKDLDTLNIKRADHYPAATDDENIAKMIEMIEILVGKEVAYQAEDQSVYFRISAFPEYGQLAHLNLDELRPTGRIQNDEYEKESIGDFALWKAWSEIDGDVGWDSPWGRGRPGWHIECSAMASRILGDEIDIHCGGVDNIFPHHEAEIAQSECCNPGKKFVRHWIHNQHLRVEGKKMAKSENNFFTLRDVLDKGYSGREIRYVLLSVRYDMPLNFTFDGLDAARKALGRIDEWVARLEGHASDAAATPLPLVQDCGFLDALDDNLNIAGALGHLFDAIRETNKLLDRGELSAAEARGVLGWWHNEVDAVLALGSKGDACGDEIPAGIQEMLDQRAAARAAKDFAASDRLRDAIAAAGWTVIDSKDGQTLKPA
jgi:cysteinyl-tRNA synthetase